MGKLKQIRERLDRLDLISDNGGFYKLVLYSDGSGFVYTGKPDQPNRSGRIIDFGNTSEIIPKMDRLISEMKIKNANEIADNSVYDSVT